MYTLFMTVFVGSGLALMMSSLHITSVKSFLIVVRIACVVGAVAGLALGAIAADVSTTGKIVVTLIGAASSAVTMLVVGLVRKSIVSKQREMAPAVTRFLRHDFRKIAKSNQSGSLRITPKILLEAMQQYEGEDLKVLQHVATHFKDIGHLVESEFILLPMTQGCSTGNVDSFLYELYAIDLKDVDTYIQRLTSMYVGW